MQSVDLVIHFSAMEIPYQRTVLEKATVVTNTVIKSLNLSVPRFVDMRD